jgi:exosortase
MIPIPSQIYSEITIPLQLFVSKASVGFVKLMDLPVLREGNVIQLPGHTLEVVQACSGLRSITSLVTLSAVFGYFTLKTNLLKCILFASGVPVAIFVNILRVVLMIIAFHFFHYDLTIGVQHTLCGILIFAIALLLIFFVGKGLLKWEKSVG